MADALGHYDEYHLARTSPGPPPEDDLFAGVRERATHMSTQAGAPAQVRSGRPPRLAWSRSSLVKSGGPALVKARPGAGRTVP